MDRRAGRAERFIAGLFMTFAAVGLFSGLAYLILTHFMPDLRFFQF